jgi:hypothetical protein
MNLRRYSNFPSLFLKSIRTHDVFLQKLYQKDQEYNDLEVQFQLKEHRTSEEFASLRRDYEFVQKVISVPITIFATIILSTIMCDNNCPIEIARFGTK